jgi:hypothetical protein
MHALAEPRLLKPGERPEILIRMGKHGADLWERALNDDIEAALRVSLIMSGHNGDRARYGMFLREYGAADSARAVFVNAWAHDHTNFDTVEGALRDMLTALWIAPWQCAGLPEVVEIWRGQDASDERTWVSWSLRRDVAEWFVTTATHGPHARCVEGLLVRRLVPRKEILAYIDDRREAEVLLWPAKLRGEWIVQRMPANGPASAACH